MSKSSSIAEVRSLIRQSKHTVIMTGAGVSAESGIPTFRGSEGLWRNNDPTRLATPQAFKSDPSLVWQFYEYRRQLIAKAKPNICHQWCAKLEKIKNNAGMDFTLITQNVDRLHQLAGSNSVIELHGSLWLIKELDTIGFMQDDIHIWEDRNVPIVSTLSDVDPNKALVSIPLNKLPQRNGKLLRPAVVWFGEALDDNILTCANKAIESCDILIVIGTSNIVYPAAGFANTAIKYNIPVIEVNLESTPLTPLATYSFIGKPASHVLPHFL